MAGSCFAHGAQHIQQQHGMTCWAACVAMLVNHRDGTTYDDVEVAREAGIDVEVGAFDSDYPAILQRWGLDDVAGACMLPEAWEALIQRSPTIVGLTGHVVVADGIDTDGTPEGTQVWVLDPASSGPEYWSYDKLEAAFELRASREIHMIQY